MSGQVVDPARCRRAAEPRHAAGRGARRDRPDRARGHRGHRRLLLRGRGGGSQHGELPLRGDPTGTGLGGRRQSDAAGAAERGHGHRSAQRPDRARRQSRRTPHRRRQHRGPQHQPLSDPGGVGRRDRPAEHRPDRRCQLLRGRLWGRAWRPALVGDGGHPARGQPLRARWRDLHEHGRRRASAGGAAGPRARIVGAVGETQLSRADCRRRRRHRHRRGRSQVQRRAGHGDVRRQSDASTAGARPGRLRRHRPVAGRPGGQRRRLPREAVRRRAQLALAVERQRVCGDLDRAYPRGPRRPRHGSSGRRNAGPVRQRLPASRRWCCAATGATGPAAGPRWRGA